MAAMATGDDRSIPAGPRRNGGQRKAPLGLREKAGDLETGKNVALKRQYTDTAHAAAFSEATSCSRNILERRNLKRVVQIGCKRQG